MRQPVELLGRGQVASEGLLHHNPRPAAAAVESRLAETRDNRRERLRRQGKVEEPISGQAVLLLQRVDFRCETTEVLRASVT